MAANFIGAIITLTSVSDIRYVGRLHSIDHQESTISLENVSSRGTETRKPQDQFVPPSDRVYDFVVFRAKDVKDLAIEQSPAPGAAAVPDDPAIMGAQSRPPPAQQSPQVPAGYPQPPPGQNYPPFGGPPGAPYGGYGMPPPPPGQGPWPPQGGMYGPGFGGPPGAPYPPPPMGGPGAPFQQPNISPSTQQQAPNGGAPPPPPPSSQPGSAPKTDAAAPADKPTPASAPKAAPAGPSSAPAPQPPTGPRAQGSFAAAAAKASPSTPNVAPQIALKPLPNAPTSAPSAFLANVAQTNLDKIERALGEMSVSRGGRGPAALNSSSRQSSAGNVPTQPRGQRPPRSAQQPGQQQQQQRQPSHPPRGPGVPDSEFDFEAGNKKFDKASVAKEAGEVLVESDSDDSSDEDEAAGADAAGKADRRASSASADPAKQQYYNKSASFFDSISSDLRPDFAGAATARGGNGGRAPPRGSNVVRGRVWRDEERVKNLDTFGEVGDGLNGAGAFGGGGGGRQRTGRGPRQGGGGGGGGRRNQGQQQQQQQQGGGDRSYGN